MSARKALITGAGGEMGHLLVPALVKAGYEVVAFDLRPLPESLASQCLEAPALSVTDRPAVEDLFARHAFEATFHLAAVLSTTAEKDPDLAHDVNVGGTLALYRIARESARTHGRSVRILFPSSIAVYGLPDAATKAKVGAVRETEWNVPTGAYGIHKLHCEMMGRFFTTRAVRNGEPGLDFRAIRFPGLVSAETLPSGGTSDFAPEMIHAAAQDRPYACFVAEHTRIPFMTMPDAIEAMLRLDAAKASSLSTRVYNIGAFSPSAGEIRSAVLGRFPGAKITFEPAAARQAIVDTWPADVDDRLARADWGHAPRHGLKEALDDYLVPSLLRRYAARPAGR